MLNLTEQEKRFLVLSLLGSLLGMLVKHYFIKFLDN